MVKKTPVRRIKKVNSVQKILGTQRKSTLAKAIRRGRPVKGLK